MELQESDLIEQIQANPTRFVQMVRELQQFAGAEQAQTEMLKETITDLVMALDARGWKPLVGLSQTDSGPNLSEIQSTSKILRSTFAGNPMAKRGIRARANYIWAGGVELSTTGARKTGIPTIEKANFKQLFSARARQELEFAAATDGNLFMLLDKSKKRVIRVPLTQIVSCVVDPDDEEIITHYRRRWQQVVGVNDDGTPKTEDRDIYYPAYDIEPRNKQANIAGREVDGKLAMIHVSFNTQTNWAFGLPDLFAAAFYLASYKEYIEAGFSVTKALAKFALKMTAPTKGGADRSAARLAAPLPPDAPDALSPTYGQVAVPYGGADVSAISKSGAAFDFDSGKPLAALVAAGLEVDVGVLLAEAAANDTAETSLDKATVDAMRFRQQVWDDFLTHILEYFAIVNPSIKFPPVRTVPVHRALQALVTAAGTNTLHPEEVRGMAVMMLNEYGIDPLPTMPKAGDWTKWMMAGVPAPVASPGGTTPGGDQKHPGTTPQKTPVGTKDPKKTGQKSPAGPLDNGTNDASKRGNK